MDINKCPFLDFVKTNPKKSLKNAYAASTSK